LVDGKKISGSIVVGVVIFMIGFLAYEVFTPDFLSEEDIEIARKNCFEKEEYYFTYTTNKDDKVLKTECKLNFDISESKSTYPKSIEEIQNNIIIENQERIIKLLEQKNIGLNYAIESYSENITNYDIILNQTTDDKNCFYQKDGAVWKFLRCD